MNVVCLNSCCTHSYYIEHSFTIRREVNRFSYLKNTQRVCEFRHHPMVHLNQSPIHFKGHLKSEILGLFAGSIDVSLTEILKHKT